MPPIVQNILGIMAVLAGLIVFAASTVAFFRANLARQQIIDLRGDRDDEKARGDRLDRELVEERALRTALEEKVRVLERVVTGKEQLEHIESLLLNHDQRVDQRHEVLSREIGNLVSNMDKVMSSNEAVKESYEGLAQVVINSTRNKQ